MNRIEVEECILLEPKSHPCLGITLLIKISQSSIDLASYGMGMTDKFKGTGVFSAIEFERENKDTTPEIAPAATAETPKKEVKETVSSN